MAITIKEESENNLILNIDNGDLVKLKEVLNKLSFKDYQSLIRFSISLLLLNEEDYITIKLDGEKKDMIPSKDLIKV